MIGEYAAGRTPRLHQREVRASDRQTMRAKYLRTQRGAVEAQCLRGERANMGAGEREEEERRGAHNNLRVFRQLPHSYPCRRRRPAKGLRKMKEILIYAGNTIDLARQIRR